MRKHGAAGNINFLVKVYARPPFYRKPPNTALGLVGDDLQDKMD